MKTTSKKNTSNIFSHTMCAICGQWKKKEEAATTMKRNNDDDDDDENLWIDMLYTAHACICVCVCVFAHVCARDRNMQAR